MRIVLGLLVCAELVLGAGVRVLFEPRGAGPFPSDALTVADERQKTGRRIALTVPIERERLRVGEEVTPGVIADFDGYAPQHRLSVRFSGPVNVDTLRDGLFYVTVGEPPAGEFGLWPVGKVTLINEVVWDPATNTAYAKPDGPLDQSRRHAVVVTDGVKDLMGDPVEASPEFTQCVETAPNDYCGALQRAMSVASVAGRITGGSVYTTMSVTAFLEAARRGLEGTDPGFARAGSRNVVEVLTVKSLTLRRQVRTSGNRFEEQVLPAPGALFAAAGVGRIAFGSFRSPRFLGREVPMMPVVPTGTPVIVSPESDEIFFHAWLPVTPPPAGGYPVILAGHGLGDDRFGMPSTLAIGLVKEGYAVVAFNAFGHGFGPEGTVRIERLDGEVFEFPYGGRGMDISGTGRIGATDGAAVVVPGAPLFFRDSLRQTALDWSQMVRAIQRGMDLLGTGRPTLDGSRISYYGQSLGAFYGSLFMAVEPNVISAALNVGGDSIIRTARLSPETGALLSQYTGTRGQVDEVLPLRYQPVKVNRSSLETSLQNQLEYLEWVEAPGAPGNYAPHFKSATLPGVPIKRILFQYVIGDRTVPNPANTALVRAANMRETTSVFRFDAVRGRIPGAPEDPHAYLALGLLGSLQYSAIALAHQSQGGEWFRRADETVPNVNGGLRLLFGRDVFETPEFLTENLNFQGR